MAKTDYEEIGEEYVRLCHVADKIIGEGYVVDGYFGDENVIKDLPDLDPPKLVSAIDRLLDRVPTLEDRHPLFRKTMFEKQLSALKLYVQLNKKLTKIDYTEGVKIITGHDKLPDPEVGKHKKLLGKLLEEAGFSGDLRKMYEAWSESGKASTEDYVKAAAALAPELWKLTKENILPDLPDGSVKIKPVETEATWSAYNLYKRNYSGEIWYNTQYDRNMNDVRAIAAHEAYPGHQAHGMFKEYLYKEGKLGIEGTVCVLINSPECNIAEGIGDMGPYFVQDWDDMDLNTKIALAYRELEKEALYQGALMMHSNKDSKEKVAKFLYDDALKSENTAKKRANFIADTTWMYYVCNYKLGFEFVNKTYRTGGKKAFKHLYSHHCPSTLSKFSWKL